MHSDGCSRGYWPLLSEAGAVGLDYSSPEKRVRLQRRLPFLLLLLLLPPRLPVSHIRSYYLDAFLFGPFEREEEAFELKAADVSLPRLWVSFFLSPPPLKPTD